MPRYTGKDLSVRLSTNKLQETCPAPSKAVSVRKTNLEKISAGLQGKDATLAERYIRIDSDGLALHYLEPDHGIPFYLVGPGFALDDIQGAGFCITVSLSELCFGSKRLEKNDVKIDAYLDGDLCGSHYVANRFHHEKYKHREQTVRFSGRRISRNLEKPFVVPGSAAFEEKGKEKAQDFDAANKAVTDTVNGLLLSQTSCHTKLGDYITRVAKLRLPSQIDYSDEKNEKLRQKLRDRTIPYSIVDVVITSGHGAKDQSGQGFDIKAPTPLRLKELDNSPGRPSTAPDTFIPRTTPVYEDLAKARTRTRSQAKSSSPVAPAPVARIKAIPTRTPSTSRRGPKTFIGPSSSSSPVKKDNKNKRGYADIFDNHQTAEQQMASIEEEAKKEADFLLEAHRRSDDQLVFRSPPAVESKPLTPRLKEKRNGRSDALTTSRTSSPLSDAPASEKSSPDNGKGTSSPPKKKQKTKGKRSSGQLMSVEEINKCESTFTPSIGEMGCYADVGTVREVRAERGGYFEEREVIFGCRMLI